MQTVKWTTTQEENCLLAYIVSKNRTKEEFQQACVLATNFPKCSTGLCVEYNDLETYQKLCDVMRDRFSGYWFRDSYIYLVTCQVNNSIAHNNYAKFLKYLLRVEGVKEEVRALSYGDTYGKLADKPYNFHSRLFNHFHCLPGLQGELDLIEELEQSPLVKSIVKGFLYPSL